MPLMFSPIFLSTALAADPYVLWLSKPADSDLAALSRTLPGAQSGSLDELMTGLKPLPPADNNAIPRLAAELEAVRPLVDVFDGELQIMARLQKATSDVHALTSPEDRLIFWKALMFTGFAVDRYFQDKLGTDPGAASYRMGEGALAQIQAWVDASALYGAPMANEQVLPESRQRIAYDTLQAFIRGMPRSTFVVGRLAEGAEVRIDGDKVEPGSRLLVTPGRHFWQVRVNDTELIREDQRVSPGIDITIQAPVGPNELEVLKELALTRQGGWEIPAPIQLVVDNKPIYVGIPGDEPRLLKISGSTSENIRIVPDDSDRDRLVFSASAGAGWSSCGDWLLLNYSEDSLENANNPPIETSTVNAATPVFSLGAAWRPIRLFSAGAGVDAMLPVGPYHTLPVGEGEQRAFFYPHLAVGIPYVHATLGPLFPWHLGVGLKANIPLIGPLGVQASGLYGAGATLTLDDGSSLKTLPIWSAWAGLSFQLGV